jgi:hypothetical protein
MKLSVKKIIKIGNRRITTETSCEYELAGWDFSESNVENIQMLFRQMIIALEKQGKPVIKDAVDGHGRLERFFNCLLVDGFTAKKKEIRDLKQKGWLK